MPSPDPEVTTADAVPQQRAPIYQAVLDYQERRVVPLHTPGHKGVLGPPGQERLLTRLGLACDLPAMHATDYPFHPTTCLAEAQGLAAEVWGAANTHFLVNGSTQGVQAMVLATLRPGDKVLLSRYVHLSVLAALALSGAIPVYLPPRWLSAAGPIPPKAEEVAAHLSKDGDIRAVLLTHPTYYGTGRPLEPMAKLCHRHGVALLVDEAHGAHLRFLPADDPRTAITSGADLVVQSVHKTIGSLVGTALIHRGHGSLVARERVQAALNLLQSTSPNYLLLASLDLARRWMWQCGPELFRKARDLALDLRQRLAAIEGVRPLELTDHPALQGCVSDPLRLVIDGSGLGMSGFEIERFLFEKHGILDEFCDTRNVVLVLGPADTPAGYDRLVQAFRDLARHSGRGPRGSTFQDQPHAAHIPPLALTPREAAFRPRARIPLDAAEGRICGETISMYPPGIPLICPGERFTAEVVALCTQLAREPVCVFSEDASLNEVAILLE